MKLFPKLFLWFLAANLISLAVTLAVIVPLWLDLEPHYSARQQGTQALEVYQTEGPRALRRLLRHQRENGIASGMLYNSAGQPAVASRHNRTPQWQAELTQMLNGKDELKLPRGGRLVAATITSDDGSQWRWVARPRPPIKPSWPLLLLRTAIASLVLLLAAWFLARRLSRPIASLQHSSRELAAGKLASRVPEKVTAGKDEVAELGRDFNHMAGRLQDSMESHRQLLADVSHELRSPLGRLQLAVELARDADTAKTGELLTRIATEGDRLEAMIADVLTISKLENAATNTPVNFDALMSGLLADARFEASNRQLTINSEPTPSLTLTANAELLRRAIENVLRNAIKYSPDGGTITVKMKHAAQTLTITINDQGPGVPETELTRLFEPFYRVSIARDRKTADDGYGLGLAIAARAVQSHGGSITASNLAAGGLAVSIQLPLNTSG